MQLIILMFYKKNFLMFYKKFKDDEDAKHKTKGIMLDELL